MNKDDKNRHFVLLIIDISKHRAKEMGHVKKAGPGFVNMLYKMQLIFLDCLFLPWNFNCLFTSRSDNYFVISGQGKFFFYWSTNQVL
jgi:hypothetical protein